MEDRKVMIKVDDEHLVQQGHKEEVITEDDEDGHEWILPRSSRRNHENSNSYSAGNNSEDDGDYVPINSPNEDDDLLVEMRRGRSNPYWTPEIEQVFIERIRSYPPLYDHSNENWKNTTVKDVIWEEISIEIGIPANECRRHFKHMRDKFVRHKRTGRGSKTWKAGEAMNFLVELDLIKHRPKNPNELDPIGPYSPEKSKLDELCPSPNGKGEGLGGETGISRTVTPFTPPAISSRSLRSMKRKSDDQNLSNTRSTIDTRAKMDTISLDNPKVSLRKPSIEMRMVPIESNGHGHPLELPLSRPNLPIIPNTPHLVLSSTIPQVMSAGKNEEPMRIVGGGGTAGHGPNYYFGQYIASVLDALPQGESLMTRHKLQEILFEAQRKSANPPLQVIQFQCTSCTNRFTPI